MPKDFINISEGVKKLSYDWRKNVKDIIEKQISLFNGQTEYNFRKDISIAQNYLNFLDYEQNNNSTYYKQIKEILIEKFTQRCHKDFRYIKRI